MNKSNWHVKYYEIYILKNVFKSNLNQIMIWITWKKKFYTLPVQHVGSFQVHKHLDKKIFELRRTNWNKYYRPSSPVRLHVAKYRHVTHDRKFYSVQPADYPGVWFVYTRTIDGAFIICYKIDWVKHKQKQEQILQSIT